MLSYQTPQSLNTLSSNGANLMFKLSDDCEIFEIECVMIIKIHNTAPHCKLHYKRSLLIKYSFRNLLEEH